MLNGEVSLNLARSDESYVTITHADEASLDGTPIELLDQPQDLVPGTTLDLGAQPSGQSWLWVTSLAFAVLLAFAVVMHGPMRGLRFKRVLRSFEERDYIEVLSRIDPFTRRRRFRRRASFLKAVSLLSLESYTEAALYIDTLGPQGPDPATRSFLKACAAAGLGQDSVAIEHLTTCFGLDPSYREEAATVPLLAALLPFFQLAEGGSVA